MNITRIVNLIKNKMFWISLLSTIGISLLTWVLQYIGIIEWWEQLLTLIGIGLTCLLAYIVYRCWLSRLGGRLFQAIQHQITEEHQLEVSALREKMKEAIDALKSSGLNIGYRGQAALYALPWFMMIGPSAAGKSTLLRHSGLHFPYSRHKEIDIKGFAGTRNCDWWFADEAIILDTAGRYTTEEEDKPEWFAFLDMLKKFRRTEPINGVVVAISLSDIVKASSDDIEDHVHIIRARLQELIQRLGIIFPVHIIFTKCDLLEGFKAFLNDLSSEARDQVWGVSLENGDYCEPDISGSFHQLYEKLCSLRMHKISLQPDSALRMQILRFPSEFKNSIEKIKPFLELLLKRNPYQEHPDFKGIYFTSGCQDLSALTSGIGKEAKQSFFVKNLFKKIIFLDKNLASSQRAKKINFSLKSMAAVFSAISIVSAVGLFQSSYDLHKTVYSRVEVLIKNHMSIGAGFTRQKAQAMNGLYDEYLRIENLIDHKNFSLYSIEKLEMAKNRIAREWISQMQVFFLRDVAQFLEIDLKNQAESWINLTPEQRDAVHASFYDHLKTYLMLCDVSHIDKAYLIPRLAEHWAFVIQNRYVEFAIPEDRLTKMVATFVDFIASPDYEHIAWKADMTLVGQSRNILDVNPSPESIYAHMISDLKKRLGYTHLNDLMGGKSYGIFESQYELPRAYTRSHYHQDVLSAIEEVVSRALEGDWVLSSNNNRTADQHSQKQLISKMRELYFNDYAETWFEFLASIQIRPFQSIEDAANKLAFLQQQEGPLSDLMGVVRENIAISNQEVIPSELIKNDKVSSVILVPELDAPFYALRRMTQPGEKMKVAESINQYFHLIGRVHSDLLTLSHASNPNREAEIYARDVFSGKERELSRAVSSLSFLLETSTASLEGIVFGEKTRNAMEPLLRSALENAWESILKSAGLYLQQEWDAQVIDAYNHTLRHKFPFSRTNVDASLEDVAVFFRPREGVLSEFQETYLIPYLQWTRNGFVPQIWLGQGVAFSEIFIESLTQAKRISEGFFRNSGSSVELTFFISPVPTPGIEEIIFDSNGQVYRYRNEPEEWRRFVWPGDSAEMGARLYVSKNDQAEWAEVHRPGVWGLFHLLNSAVLIREAGAQYLSQWKVKDAQGNPMNIRFKLRADKQNNIFEPGLLQQFSLPDQMISNEAVSLAQHEEG